jgi:hypothetical protein
MDSFPELFSLRRRHVLEFVVQLSFPLINVIK